MAASQVQAREEDLRRTVALQHAAEELTSILDPDEVVATATRLATELVSAPGTGGTRAQYFTIHDDVVSFAAQFDEAGTLVHDSFALGDHPNLFSVYLSRQALACPVELSSLGANVRSMASQLGITYSVYVPILRDGRIDGILGVAVRDASVPPELFEQCKAFGHLLELALANAWSHKDLGRQAITDAMTGLPNRRGFDSFLEQRPGRRSFAVLAMDVDGLKQVNDTRGHDAGDALLTMVATTLKGAMRRGDVLARLGGDEFVAYLIDADVDDGRAVATRMLSDLTAIGDGSSSVSIGIAVGAHEDDFRAVHRAADTAMYDAKRAGGRRYRVDAIGVPTGRSLTSRSNDLPTSH
jgi:diguanylate cyclase (GGDEF)-like protein